MIMVNHAAYPFTAAGNRPATLSPYWVHSVLRQRMGYRGIIFSDDMEMGGVLKFAPIEDAVVAAIRAGMDLLEICHSPELILRAFEALIAEAERSTAFRQLLQERARETSRKRARLFTDEFPRALSARQFEALRDRILRFGDSFKDAGKSSSPSAARKNASKAETA